MFDPVHDSIEVMTLYASKDLELPVMALVGAARMPAEHEEVRLFSVWATRATQRLILSIVGTGRFGALLDRAA